MKLRVIESEWNVFIDGLRARSDVETAGIVLGERLHDGEVLLARHLVEVPAEGYLIRRDDQLRIDPIALNRLIRPARDGGLSVITVHTHPGATKPWFSHADDLGDGRLMPSLFHQMAGPHGSVVIAGATGLPVGRVWSQSGEQGELGIRIVGCGLRIFPQTNASSEELGWFDRQRLAIGEFECPDVDRNAERMGAQVPVRGAVAIAALITGAGAHPFEFEREPPGNDRSRKIADEMREPLGEPAGEHRLFRQAHARARPRGDRDRDEANRRVNDAGRV